MRNLLLTQTLVVPLVAGALLYFGTWAALSALCGGAIALGNSLLIARRVVRGRRKLAKDPTTDVGSMYLGAFERFAFTVIAMALALGWLKLSPPMLLIGFAVAYLAYPLSRVLPVREGAQTQ